MCPSEIISVECALQHKIKASFNDLLIVGMWEHCTPYLKVSDVLTLSMISQPVSHPILIIKKEPHDVSEHLLGGIQITFNAC